MIDLREGVGGAPTLIGDVDLHLFNEGTHARLHEQPRPARRQGGRMLARAEELGREALHGERALVEERCLYTPVPILLNGAAPFG